MDVSQLLRALGLQQAYQSYQQNIGQPFTSALGQASQAYQEKIGKPTGEFASGLLGLESGKGSEAYRIGQAAGNIPPTGGPAGAIVSGIAQSPRLLTSAIKAIGESPELLGLLGTVLPKGTASPTVRLYHGGNIGLEEIKGGIGPGNIFGGIFGSQNRRVASSHGDGSVYRMDVPEEAILSQQMLDSMSPEKLSDVLKKVMPRLKNEDVGDAFTAVIQDAPHKIDDDRLMRIFRENSPGEAGWEAQRIRGEVARLLGKKAVEMADEHGVSYLVLPGVKPVLDVE